MILLKIIHIKAIFILLFFNLCCFSYPIKDYIINAYIDLSLELNKDYVGDDKSIKDCDVKELKFPNSFSYKIVDDLEQKIMNRKNLCELFGDYENNKIIVYDSIGKYKKIDTSLIKIEIKNNNGITSEINNKCLSVIYEMYFDKLLNKGFYFSFGKGWIVKSFKLNNKKKWEIIDENICGWID